MSRKRTGLRNKFRSGRSSYSVKGKASSADKYGSYQQGRMATNENIAGKAISTPLRGAKKAEEAK